MDEVTLGQPFFSLPGLGLDALVPVSLYSFAFEAEVGLRNGSLNLGSLSARVEISDRDLAHYHTLVPCFDTYPYPRTVSRSLLESLVAQHHEPEKEQPHAMLVKNVQELEAHVLIAYQVAYAHYVLGKKHNLKKSFPFECCGVSSMNVALSLMSHGYSNAVIGNNDMHDHSYVILPFVIEKTEQSGVIVVDPTVDQFMYQNKPWDPIRAKPRNMVFIGIGTGWVHTLGDHQDDSFELSLFPSRILYFGLIKDMLTQLKSQVPELNLFNTTPYFWQGNKYLKLAYKRPLKLTIPYLSAQHS